MPARVMACTNSFSAASEASSSPAYRASTSAALLRCNSRRAVPSAVATALAVARHATASARTARASPDAMSISTTCTSASGVRSIDALVHAAGRTHPSRRVCVLSTRIALVVVRSRRHTLSRATPDAVRGPRTAWKPGRSASEPTVCSASLRWPSASCSNAFMPRARAVRACNNPSSKSCKRATHPFLKREPRAYHVTHHHHGFTRSPKSPTGSRGASRAAPSAPRSSRPSRW